MLPAPSRLRRPAEFAQAVRRGRRAGRGALVLHLQPDVSRPDTALVDAARPDPAHPDAPARVGLVVGKPVGPAVVRNRVRRRLRELLRVRLSLLPAGSVLVVRALPGAADASFAALGADLDAALRRVLREPARTEQAR